MWGICQNKLWAFLHLICKSLFLNALREAIFYPSTAAFRRLRALRRPSRSRIGTDSRLRPHRNPDYPKENDEADERDEGNAKRVGIGQDHRFL